jgi:CRP-like cAMP-binding protein
MNLSLDSANAGKDPQNLRRFIETLRSSGKEVHFKKNEVIFAEGRTANFMLIVKEGVLRTYRLVNDKEVVLGFTFPGDLETSPVSFIAQSKSNETIDAVCYSRALKISRDLFFKKLSELQLSEDIVQSILLKYIEVLISRHLDLKAFTAEENYINLLMKQPKLVSKIPLKDIASFLGISQERLSRIRKKHELT